MGRDMGCFCCEQVALMANISSVVTDNFGEMGFDQIIYSVQLVVQAVAI